MSTILELQQLCKNQPIAPIFERLKEEEKSDETALKLLLVINYVVLQRNLYARIGDTKLPKLLHELLGFHTFKSFTYYNYAGNVNFNGKFLQCKFGQCQFSGPYMIVLTHMAINHNAHYSTTKCLYCCRIDLKTHFENDSFQQCYETYSASDNISDMIEEATGVHDIIVEFYDTLKKCAETLGVCTQRKLHRFEAKGVAKSEQLSINGRGMSNEAVVYKPNPRLKRINIGMLNREFNKAKEALYVANGDMRFTDQSNSQAAPMPDSHDELISSDSDDDEPQPEITITRVISMPDRSAESVRAPSTSAMSIQSNTTFEHGMSTPQPSFDAFIQLVNEGYNGIQNRKIRRELQQKILKEIANAEDEELQQNH